MSKDKKEYKLNETYVHRFRRQKFCTVWTEETFEVLASSREEAVDVLKYFKENGYLSDLSLGDLRILPDTLRPHHPANVDWVDGDDVVIDLP